jgi:leukotriene-A4 hydrolase
MRKFLSFTRPWLAKQASPSLFTSPPTRRFSLTTAAMAGHRDPNTLSNYDAWRTRHTTATFTVDFAQKCLRGSVVLELVSQTDASSREIVLDTSHVAVSAVRLDASPSTKWEVGPPAEPNGSPLRITVPAGAARGDSVKLEIDLATTAECTALQWLTPAQTSNGRAPFMFSQAQAVHARSLFPCQDTPDVKSTYDFNITSPYVVVASGVPVGDAAGADAGEAGRLYRFQQKVPIPSYLFALASGDIATAKIGRRSVVATAPEELAAAKWELEESMDKFMDAAEKLTFPYQWGEYNVLVLPPSFPYGGKLSCIIPELNPACFFFFFFC